MIYYFWKKNRFLSIINIFSSKKDHVLIITLVEANKKVYHHINIKQKPNIKGGKLSGKVMSVGHERILWHLVNQLNIE